MKPYNAMYKKEEPAKETAPASEVEKKEEVSKPEVEKKVEAPKENKTVYESPKKKVEKDAKVARCEMVNVRKEASIMSPVLEIVDRDVTVKTSGKVGDFTKVKTQRGIEGFIMTEYLDEV